jgi:putative addiction module component (TIGR02574 family)
MHLDPIEPDITEEQKAELDRRLDEDDAAPDDAVPWEEVKAQALARIRKRAVTSAQPVEPDDELADDLIGHSPKFRALLERSLASGREPFPFADPEE